MIANTPIGKDALVVMIGIQPSPRELAGRDVERHGELLFGLEKRGGSFLMALGILVHVALRLFIQNGSSA